jgi:hypothetical protein
MSGFLSSLFGSKDPAAIDYGAVGGDPSVDLGPYKNQEKDTAPKTDYSKYVNALAPLGLLGAGIFSGNQNIPGQNTLQKSANSMISQGQSLMDPLLKGSSLPAGGEAFIQGNAQAQKAALASQFASAGLSGSSMAAEALAGVDQQAAAQRFQIANQMYSQGVSQFTQGNAMLDNLGRQILQQDNALQSALVGFASALAGGGEKSKSNNLVSSISSLFS